jgi:uncharacterized membrane protein YfcA
MSFFFLIYPLIGLIGGFLAGLLGIGGGLVIVPALIVAFPYQGLPAAAITHAAVATSLATVIITSAIAAYTHHRHRAVEWPVFWRMAPGLLCGALGGAMVAAQVSGGILRVCFALFALLVAMQMGFRLQPAPHGRLPTAAGLAAVGGIIGVISAMVGVGGGTLTVPFLRWSNVVLQRAIATSSACGFPIALGGSLGFSSMAVLSQQSTAIASIGIYWPAALWIGAASIVAAPFGARLTHRISTALLTQGFAVVLALVGLRLLWA